MDRRYNLPNKTLWHRSSEEEEGEFDRPPPSPPQRESMTSWLSRASSSTQAQFAATAILAGAVTAGAILGYQHVRRQERVEDLKSSIPELGRGHYAEKVGMIRTWTIRRIFTGADDEVKLTNFGAASPTEGITREDERSMALAARAQKGDYDEELILEQLARNRVFLTEQGLTKIRTGFFIVVGCGGVGSHCVSALARSGASTIRLIDFDQVSLSSLNRHAVATLADVGISKVHCLRKRLQAVTPWVTFDCRNQIFDGREADTLLGPTADGKTPDFIIDAIDNIDSKVDLLAYCYRKGLRVMSSMGAGCKSDPTRIFIGDISTSTEDHLSRAVRRRLRAPPYNIASGIPVVYSSEKPGPGKAQLLPLPEEEFQKGKVGELAPMQDFRVRILPVLGTMPAVFGYAVANHVILTVAGHPVGYSEAKSREKMYDGILAQVQGSEEKLVRAMAAQGKVLVDIQGLKVPITPGDIGYVVEEVFKGRSAISGLPTRLALVRWRRPEGPTMSINVEGQKSSNLRLRDLVCLTKEEAVLHERDVVRGSKIVEDLYDEEIVARIEATIEEEIWYEKYR